jgi:hypothetical protein
MVRSIQTVMAVAILVSPSVVSAWNIPTHMVSAAIAYHTLQRESPTTIEKVSALLEKHPWYANRWRNDLDRMSVSQRGEMLFMLAARWADDIRNRDQSQHRAKWHYINWPFKPASEPVSVQTHPPQPVNILSAFAENERLVRSGAEPEKRAIAIAWLFHLVGDVHQPLHAVQLFTREYPQGDRGGNEICVRVAQDRAPLDLHRLWDGLITSSNNVNRLWRIATNLQGKFTKAALPELASADIESWATESYSAAVEVAYQNGVVRGTPRRQARDCREVPDAAVLPNGYAPNAGRVADRRIVLAGYRLSEFAKQLGTRK